MIYRFHSYILITILCFQGISQGIKAISFNIRLETTSDGNNQWDLRKSSVSDFLKYESPDFVGMQEVLWSQMEDLGNSLEDLNWIGVGRDDGKKSGEFSPIFYNANKWKLVKSNTFWLSQTPEKPSKSWDAALPRVCTWGLFSNKIDGDEIYVFNTHFDHIGEEARKNAARIIGEKIKEMTNFKNSILLGDFNLEPDSEPIKKLKETPMKDAFDEASMRFGSVGTFNAFNYSKIPVRRIDYVFVSPDFSVLRYGVASHVIEGRYLSDHFPVVAILELN